ncbi:MAG: hypothetical protein HGA76_02245 [Candidatus Firestonebacteria bacterium]|nr:hypothetical protein [Candidatus Firestonebacteria bacterium]
MNNLIKLCGCLAMAWGLAGTAAAEIEFIPLVDASAAVSSGKFETNSAGSQVDPAGNTHSPNDNSSSGDFYLSLAPNFRFTGLPNLWITPYLEFDYTGANNLMQIEDEAFVFAKRLYFYYVLGASYDFNKTWTMKVKGFGRIENSAETKDESLNDGLYNYRDAGGWLEGRARYELGVPMATKWGYKAYLRRYPFYTNQDLINQYKETGNTLTASLLPEDLHEKDVNVNETWLRQEFAWGSWPVLTNLELKGRLVRYTEMPVVIEDGTLSPDLRQDVYVDAALELPVQLHRYHQIELDYQYELHGSNQNYYTTSGPLFIGGYYNYYQNSVRFLYNAVIPLKLAGFMPKLAFSISGQNRVYPGRPSRQKTSNEDTVGAYTGQAHWENTADIGVVLKQQLFADWFALFFSFHGISQSSNDNVDDSAPYNFKYNTFTLGSALSF